MTVGLGRLARSIEEVGTNLGAMQAIERPDYRTYEPHDGDVFITSWAKSGTTMTQQMFHQLRMLAATGEADMDFDDISRMTPWEDTAQQNNFDMNVPQKASPRGFKSHREYERLEPGMRYIVTLRDPHETYHSFHRFFSGYLFEPGTIPMEEFFPLWMMGGPGGCDYYTHLLSWYARRNEPDTLLVTYRWMVKNKEAMIRKMAGFLGIDADDAMIDRVDALTTREFMYEHKDKFDDAMIKQGMAEMLGLHDLESSKVKAEGSDAKQVPPAIAAQIDALWAERVAPVTGHKDFASLAAEVDALQG
ncbi:sulfotransferase domain-containing protein [Qipengyuania soli]|uniref:Sulfotransferase domain-containing protein n=1 Tax=Qipengyuania soli TaxID=2782568 RepID=A0A7S8IVL1_9SPHN|nr:sulfotransferase domain-containing protein [Qipengyuania soli]QPC98926.1 sulfotransferase domain-containing protein [Qipengyuania soli]